MPLERLLFSSCLLPGITRFQENKTFVEISPEKGETILFFCIDDKSGSHLNCSKCGLRSDLWGNKEGNPICDLLVFYAKDDRRVLCFVELKDNKKDFRHAVEQVTHTYNTIKEKLRLTNNYTIQAFLVGYTGSVPQNHKESENVLNNCFGKNYSYRAKNTEFADFLRGTLVSRTRKLKEKKRSKRRKD